MALKEPESMDDCFYFTNRTLENGGWVKAWVYRPLAPSGKARLQKPVNPKTGRPKSRSTFYVDPATGEEYPCDEINPTLNMEIKYKSPYDGHEGETTIPYKRKKYKGVDAFVFECGNTGEKIAITKKMKAIKKKKKKA